MPLLESQTILATFRDISLFHCGQAKFIRDRQSIWLMWGNLFDNDHQKMAKGLGLGERVDAGHLEAAFQKRALAFYGFSDSLKLRKEPEERIVSISFAREIARPAYLNGADGFELPNQI